MERVEERVLKGEALESRAQPAMLDTLRQCLKWLEDSHILQHKLEDIVYCFSWKGAGKIKVLDLEVARPLDPSRFQLNYDLLRWKTRWLLNSSV